MKRSLLILLLILIVVGTISLIVRSNPIPIRDSKSVLAKLQLADITQIRLYIPGTPHFMREKFDLPLKMPIFPVSNSQKVLFLELLQRGSMLPERDGLTLSPMYEYEELGEVHIDTKSGDFVRVGLFYITLEDIGYSVLDEKRAFIFPDDHELHKLIAEAYHQWNKTEKKSE